MHVPVIKGPALRICTVSYPGQLRALVPFLTEYARTGQNRILADRRGP
jgi:hypothetical protein